jgi:hypothetical protein
MLLTDEMPHASQLTFLPLIRTILLTYKYTKTIPLLVIQSTTLRKLSCVYGYANCTVNLNYLVRTNHK